MNNFKERTDDQLVEDIEDHIIGTGSGRIAQGAQAELTVRLINTIESLDKTTSNYSEKLLNASLILLLITLVQLMVSVFSTPFPLPARLFIWISLAILIVYETNKLILKVRKRG